jgi:hypothetical protein
MASQPRGQIVHQIFTPVLPDELRLTRLGERLAIVKTFDDGWCIARRAKHCPPYHLNTDSAHTTTLTGSGVEVGAVPAWCFVQPVDGLRSERPIRRSSLYFAAPVDTKANPKIRQNGAPAGWF